MSGKLLFISGLSGSGKTTLIGAALRVVPGLSYLHTVTTRPPREGEQKSFEYDFVSREAYQQLRQRSKQWDHTAYKGNWYGADVAAARELLGRGQHVICSVAPDDQVIHNMARLYGVPPLTIWVDTPTQVARERIAHDVERSGRNEDANARSGFVRIFLPQGNLERDKTAFIELIEELLG